MRTPGIGGCIAAVLAAMPAAAAVTRYECNFPENGRLGGGWVPTVVVVQDDDRTGKIMVFDPLIKNFVGVPIEARRGDETVARVTFVWTLETRVKQQAAKMTYRLTHYRNGRPATVKVLPGGYDNSFSGDGTCKVSKS